MSAQVEVIVGEVPACDGVKASIETGRTVNKGRAVELFCTTAGARIYYTLDGSCPCVAGSASRLLYTGPVILDRDTHIIAYSVKEGYQDSKPSSYEYKVVIPLFP